MKCFNFYLSLMLLLVLTTACNDEFDAPNMTVPVAQHKANMTIAEFKAKYWQDARNYIDTVKEDIVIHGWVTSSDESGNIYKSLYIMDETGGLTISINQNSLYNNYRIGQEVVLPMKGYFVGKYNGQQQLGYPEWYAKEKTWEATFLPQAMWESIVELNGLPDLSKVDTLQIELSEIAGKTDRETQLKYQGRLVRINDVKFTEADGVTTYSLSNASTSRDVVDDENNSLTLRNSNYADFRADVLPKGKVDIVGLLYFYGSDWQLYLRDINDVIVGGSPGSKSRPFTVAEAIASLGKLDTGQMVWIGGYAVGAVAPEVTTVTSNDDIEWMSPTTLDNTIVLADDPECKDFTKCIIVPLPYGSHFRAEANMESNLNVYQTFVKVKGEISPYMGIVGITGNTGSTSEYVLDVALLEMEETFDAGIPDSWTNVTVSGSGSWSNYSYPKSNPTPFCAQIYNTGSAAEKVESWLISPKLDLKKAKSKIFNFVSEVNNTGNIDIEVYLLNSNDPTEATFKEKLNPILPAHPSSGYSAWTSSGNIDLRQWADGCYYIGFCYSVPNGAAHTTWCIDDVTFGIADGGPSGGKSDFETMPGRTTTLGTYSSTAGWIATNSTLLEGGSSDNNPTFAFIGFATGSTTQYAKAPTLSGGTETVGKLVSPTLTGGMSKLRFNYGCAYSGKVLAFRVDVIKNGQVVKTWTITDSNVTSKNAYTFEENCSVTGDFTLEFTNLCPSNESGATKDRLSIWNVNWDAAE